MPAVVKLTVTKQRNSVKPDCLLIIFEITGFG